MTTTSRSRGLNRQILALAVPAFGALVAEPLFLLADSAIVGHLGTPELAGVGVAATVVQTVVGLMVFLAYSTTPAVASRKRTRNDSGKICRNSPFISAVRTDSPGRAPW